MVVQFRVPAVVACRLDDCDLKRDVYASAGPWYTRIKASKMSMVCCLVCLNSIPKICHIVKKKKKRERLHNLSFAADKFLELIWAGREDTFFCLAAQTAMPFERKEEHRIA